MVRNAKEPELIDGWGGKDLYQYWCFLFETFVCLSDINKSQLSRNFKRQEITPETASKR